MGIPHKFNLKGSSIPHYLFRPKPRSCNMKFERLSAVNLVWHDVKLQHGSFNVVGIEEPVGTVQMLLTCRIRN